jgi:hypothetical protein
MASPSPSWPRAPPDVQILLGAVVLAAVLLIGLGRGRRGGRLLAGAGVTVLVFVATAAAWWLVLFLGLVRLDPLLPFDRHAASTRALGGAVLGPARRAGGAGGGVAGAGSAFTMSG